MSLWLMHYGVKGMDWDVRRYEDVNGHLTELGKIKKQMNKLADIIDELQTFIVRGEEFLDRGKE